MTLADLIDLEVQLARDRDADPAVVGARDRALLRREPLPADRGALLSRWLAALREAEPGRAWPGRSIAGALRLTRVALVVLGLALGWGAATALLRGGGAHPVNVWDFLLAFVGIQILLLALLLASFFLPLALVGEPAAGVARAFAGAVAAGLAGRDPDEVAEARATWHRLRTRRSLYHRLEPWLLLATTQAFGVAFNVGALAALLRLVTFTDLSFAWSTTLLDLDGPRFHALVSAIAAPWGWAWPDAVPSRELVDWTRYSHLAQAYLGGAHPGVAGGWWPFLAAALLCYGLLPRAALLALAAARAAAELRALPLDDAEAARAAHRLTEPDVVTRAPAPEVAGPAPAAGALPPTAHEGGRRGALLLWRDAPADDSLRAALERQARCALPLVRAAGEDPAPLDGADPVVVLAESWEAPDRATLRFLRRLREEAGPGRHLLVVLADTASGAARTPAAEPLRIWREGLAALEDPRLAVEPLREAP